MEVVATEFVNSPGHPHSAVKTSNDPEELKHLLSCRYSVGGIHEEIEYLLVKYRNSYFYEGCTSNGDHHESKGSFGVPEVLQEELKSCFGEVFHGSGERVTGFLVSGDWKGSRHCE